MRAFRNMSVRYKIMIPLVTLAVIILLMGITNYSGMSNIMDASTSISGNYARCLDMVGISIRISSICRGLRTTILWWMTRRHTENWRMR